MALMLGLFAALCWAIHDLAARHLAPTIGAFRLGLLTEAAGFVLMLPLLPPPPLLPVSPPVLPLRASMLMLACSAACIW